MTEVNIPIKFHRHPFKCYLAGVLFVVCQLALITLGVMHVVAIRNTDEFYTHNCVFFISGLVLFFIETLYTGYYYWLNSPILVLDENKIHFNQEAIDWQDVRRIELSYYYSFYGTSAFNRFGKVRVAVLYLRDDSFKCIYYSMYQNAQKLELELQSIKTSNFK